MRKSVTVNVQVRIKPDPVAERSYQAVKRLTDDPAVLVAVLTSVMKETLLEAYRKRFVDAEGRMTGMEKVSEGRKPARGDRQQEIADELLDIERKVSLGQMSPAAAALRRSQLSDEAVGGQGLTGQGLEGMTGEVGFDPVEGLSLVHGRGRGSLSTGQFRVRMAKVLELLTSADQIEIVRNGKDLILGIGRLDKLDKVITPSHGDPATGGRSKHKILWRQLEFGTGIYAKPSPRPGPTNHKTAAGTWWYGPGVGRGLHLRGSRSANVLRQRTGLPYDSDALLFRGMLFERLNRALSGR